MQDGDGGGEEAPNYFKLATRGGSLVAGKGRLILGAESE